jgi:hypothetical protein
MAMMRKSQFNGSRRWINSFIGKLYSKIYSHPKTEILGCDKTIPLEQNLIPRFAKSRGKQKG